jgi:hypothetical protein
MPVRRVTVELDQPTRNGETEIHMLTNLPAGGAGSRKVAALYRRRWTVELPLQRDLFGDILNPRNRRVDRSRVDRVGSGSARLRIFRMVLRECPNSLAIRRMDLPSRRALRMAPYRRGAARRGPVDHPELERASHFWTVRTLQYSVIPL